MVIGEPSLIISKIPGARVIVMDLLVCGRVTLEKSISPTSPTIRPSIAKKYSMLKYKKLENRLYVHVLSTPGIPNHTILNKKN